jgi:choice-of-anchor A domain-containing protein
LECTGDLGQAARFNVFVEDDYLGATDVGGWAAAGDLLQMRGFSLGLAHPGGPAAVAGRLDLRNGRVYGNAWWDVSRSIAPSVTFVGGGPLRGAPVDFSDAFADLRLVSDQIALSSANGASSVDAWGNILLEGTDPALNVFRVDGAWFATATSLTLRVPAGATTIVDVTGASITMSGFAFLEDGATAERTLLNFADASALDLSRIGIEASILAPDADARFFNGQIDGQIFARSLRGDGEPHWVPFVGDLACP